MRGRLIHSLTLFAAVYFWTGCSVYQSDGRKILERNLSSIGVTVQAQFTGCNHDLPQHDWSLLENHADTRLYSSESQTFALRVTATEDESFSCYYTFSSAQDMYERLQAAREHTLAQLLVEDWSTIHDRRLNYQQP